MPASLQIARGMNMTALLRLWAQAGGRMETRRRTGEARLVHDRLGVRSSLFSARRKDAPLKLVVFVRNALTPRASG